MVMTGLLSPLLCALSVSGFLPSGIIPHIPRCSSPTMVQQSGGNYAVSSGAWPAKEQAPRPTAAEGRRRVGKGAKQGGVRAPIRKRREDAAPALRQRTRKADFATKSGSPILSRVLQRVGKLSPTASAEEIEDLLHDKKLSSRDYGTVLRELRLQGKWSAALKVGDWLYGEPGPLPNAMHYVTMMHACAAASQPEAALNLLSQLEAHAVPLPSQLRVQAIAHAIAAHKRATDLTPIVPLLDQLDDMLPSEVEPAGLAFGYAAAIRAFDLSGQWSVALQVARSPAQGSGQRKAVWQGWEAGGEAGE